MVPDKGRAVVVVVVVLLVLVVGIAVVAVACMHASTPSCNHLLSKRLGMCCRASQSVRYHVKWH